MPTYPLPTLACTVNSSGISAPALSDIINSMVASIQAIFGTDLVLTPDTQIGQLIGILASAQNDSNNATIAAYNQFNPVYSQGVGQDTTYKINGIQREGGTYSTIPIACVGVAGTVINFGIVQDSAGNLWDLPSVVTIPLSGTITVTATAQAEGAIGANAGAMTIYTKVLGWQTATATSAATPGTNAESDAQFRQRQTISTSLTSITPLQAVAAALANLTGISRSVVYENPTGAVGTGLETPPLVPTQPPHSICCVVAGSASTTSIAQTIEKAKSPGTSTSEGMAGLTTVIVDDPSGVPIAINFFELSSVGIYVSATIKRLAGWQDSTTALIQAAIVNFINNLGIGDDVYYNWMFGPACLYGSGLEFTFQITALTIGTAPAPVGTSDITINFNQAATTIAADVVLTVV